MSLDDNEGSKLWERAAAAKPHDEDLIITWLNSAISGSDWQNAQKATTTLRKGFPKDRKYDYWNIMMCYLISQDETAPEQTRKLFGTLANRMITKAAEDRSERGISNVEELVLFARILLDTNSASSLIDLLSGPALRAIIEQDHLTADGLLLEALKVKHDPDATRRFLESRLVQDTEKLTDDDNVWYLYVSTNTSTTLSTEALDLIEQKLQKHPKHKQALLARIALLSAQHKDGQTVSADLLQHFVQYYELFGSKAFCFDDLVVYLARLGPEFSKSFRDVSLKSQADNGAEAHQLFLLKLRYFLLFQREPLASEAISFATSALNLSESRRDDPATAAESMLLAALSLLRVAVATNQATHRHQASMLLHTASARYKDYYPLRILLIQVQMVNGQIHLAMNNFFELNVKNLQWETLGHYILTRISTLHPQQYGHGEESLNPLGALDTALSVFNSAQKSFDRAIRDGLHRYQSYGNVLDTIKTRKELQRSIVVRLYGVEEIKCQRLLGIPVTSRLEASNEPFSDLRDTSFMPRYGIPDGQLDEYLQCGIQPGKGWLSAMTLHEHLISWLQAETQADASEAFSTLTASFNTIAHTPDDLTQAESGALAVYRELVEIATSFVKQDIKAHPSLDTAFARYKSCDWLSSPTVIDGVQCPDWKYVHTQYVRLENLQTFALFTVGMQKKVKAEKDKSKFTALKKSLDKAGIWTKEEVDTVYREVRSLKEQLNASGVLTRLVDAALGRSDDSGGSEASELVDILGQLQNEAAVEEYCGTMRESWEDVLDGILAVKIRTI